MPSNPYLNAVLASGYIWCIGLFFSLVASRNANTPDTFMAPIVMLSLLVFSVATMGFLFFYRPALLMLEHKPREAVEFFLRTLATFGVLTLLAVLAVL